MTGLLQQLISFPNSCIYALVDEANKGMFICFCESRGLTSLMPNIVSLKRGVHDYKLLQEAFNNNSLDIRVLKDYKDNPPDEAVIRAEMMHMLAKSGYRDLRGDGPPTSYRLKLRILGVDSDTPLVYVSCKSTTVNELLLGIFDSIHEAEDWMSATYPGQRDSVGIIPRFAVNERTREYHKAYGYKLQRKKL